ncbi:MAG: ABC transporter ATP-binding protein [Candidatus Loosdrechtia sp.]|uniref:ABC transporter ATP-binding protein n=1 Tax=Candidatus Loosdrechtia sp. TaxID=3101272 RepID=UPI003A619E26|nr:MAG: ATP-binding cassette domain-containing protein [Candidatus Jettenia sp. AMX2]
MAYPGVEKITGSEIALEVNGLYYSYAATPVLEKINLRILRGMRLAVAGPSGCGKTTLLKICAGLLPVRAGEIRRGYALGAFVFQQPFLLPWKSAGENISLGLKARGVSRNERMRQTVHMAEYVGLTRADLKKYPHQLSGGMQCRTAFARALVLDPDMVFLDEPFASLDIGLKYDCYRFLITRKTMSMLLITHDLTEAVRLADTILIMAPNPGHVAGCFDIRVPIDERDESMISDYTNFLLSDPVVQTSFRLK